VELIADSGMSQLADPDDSDGDGVSGRLPDGRFGWKAKLATLRETVAAAFVTEFGLTSELYPRDGPGELRPPEITATQLDAVVAFIRSLGQSRRVSWKNDDQGSQIFASVGCAVCHRTDLGGHQSAFTDLLLHDMGPALADGIREGNASEQEFRTAPLAGLGASGPLICTMHARPRCTTPSSRTAAKERSPHPRIARCRLAIARRCSGFSGRSSLPPAVSPDSRSNRRSSFCLRSRQRSQSPRRLPGDLFD